MPGRTKKILPQQLSPEISSPVNPNESNILDDGIENQMAIESKNQLQLEESKTNLDPMTILLANGQPLLTNFEEKYLIDLILKTSHRDIETILREKIPFILQMNYEFPPSSFTLNSSWIFDFILKHFQTLIEHTNASELFDKFLKKTVDQNNLTIIFKHWQLQTLVTEHSKKASTSSVSKKRRMTVRHIHLK